MNSVIQSTSEFNYENAYEIACQLLDSLDVANSTSYDYKVRVKDFLRYIESTGFNSNILISYKKSLASRTYYTASTKNKYLVSARSLIGEMVKKGLLSDSFPREVKSFKQSKKHKRFGLSGEEIKAISSWSNQLPSTPKTCVLGQF
jgi:hypothetical protein